MLPSPATRSCSSKADFSMRVLRRSSRSSSEAVNSSDRGSNPSGGSTRDASSNARDPYATRPKRRVSSNRSSRPSSRRARRCVWRAAGSSASQTNRCPVMPRCTMSSSPPSSPRSRNFPRRSTLVTLCPVSTCRNTSGGGMRSTSSRRSSTDSKRCPTSAPRRPRARVPTYGNSCIDVPGSGGGCHRDGRHLAPVVADLDVNFEGNGQGGGSRHRISQYGNEPIHLGLRRFEEELVVHLEQHARLQARFANRGIDPNHGSFHDVGRGTLDGHVHRHALRRLTDLAVCGADVRQVPSPAVHRLHPPVLSAAIAHTLQVT